MSSIFSSLFDSYSSFNVIILCALCLVVLCFACIIVKTRQNHLLHSTFLVEHLDDWIEPNDYVMKELDDCYTEIAIRLFEMKNKLIFTNEGKYRNMFLQCRNNVRNQFKYKVLVQSMKSKFNTFVSLKFNREFADFVEQNYPEAAYGELFDILLFYFDYLNPKLNIMKSKDEDVIEPDVDTNTKILVETEEQEMNLAKSVQQVYEDVHNEKLKKQAYIDAYKKTILSIQSNHNIGLLPLHPEFVSKELLDFISFQPVIGQRKFIEMATDNTYQEMVGCYIIYNTYTNKYFVGKANRPFHRAYAVLTDKVKTNSTLLSVEFLKGHMMLLKSIPLLGSGYDSVDELQKVLVRAYGSLYPNGYNNGYNVSNKKLKNLDK